MNVNDAFPSIFLKSSDIGGIAAGQRIRVKIADVKLWEDQQGSKKLSIGFVGSKKRLLANVTNSRTIAKAYGEETDAWTGRDIILYVQMVDFRGNSTEALRILIPQPEQPAKVPFKGGAHQPTQPAKTAVQPPEPPQDTISEINPPPHDGKDAFGLPLSEELDDEIPF